MSFRLPAEWAVEQQARTAGAKNISVHCRIKDNQKRPDARKNCRMPTDLGGFRRTAESGNGLKIYEEMDFGGRRRLYNGGWGRNQHNFISLILQYNYVHTRIGARSNAR
ncbi:hypothetical protein [Acidithiobacillus sp.]